MLKQLTDTLYVAPQIGLDTVAEAKALGILGEYIAQIFERSMRRPSYTIGATTDRIPVDPQPSVPVATVSWGDQRLLQGA